MTRKLSMAAVLVLVSLLTSCSSVENEDVDAGLGTPQSCPVAEGATCVDASDPADDRGYDPCLVNAKLPICEA